MTPNVVDRTALIEVCGLPAALRLVRRLQRRTIPQPGWISWWCRGRRPMTKRRLSQGILVEILGKEGAVELCAQFHGLRFPSYSRMVVVAQRRITAAFRYCDAVELRALLESAAPLVTSDRRGVRRLVRRRLAEAGR